MTLSNLVHHEGGGRQTRGQRPSDLLGRASQLNLMESARNIIPEGSPRAAQEVPQAPSLELIQEGTPGIQESEEGKDRCRRRLFGMQLGSTEIQHTV